MRSYFDRYVSGEHETVWAELNQNWPGFSETYHPEPKRHCSVDREDAEAVLTETFARVVRNTDRLTQRLRDTGYRFESESGRHAPPRPPRRAADLSATQLFLDQTFGDHSTFDKDTPTLPPALRAFADIVGSVDLRQRHPYAPDPMLPDASLNPEAFPDVPEAGPTGGDSALLEHLRDLLPEPEPLSAQERVRRAEIARLDQEPHPSADPVIARHGDWDPLEIDFDFLQFSLTDDEAEPVIDNGMIWPAEIAASFEHKAVVSGATNPWIAFPQAALDPIVQAEGHYVTFTNYLRRAFRNGGFFGIPRIAREGQKLQRETTPGLFLPDHPIFASLAKDMEPF